MNLFRVIFLDIILIFFPILIYLIYLSTNKNITTNSKKAYLRLSLLTSFFIICNYSIKDYKLLSIMIMSSIIILSYLENMYVFANILSVLVLLIYNTSFNNTFFLIIGYILIFIIYMLKKNKNINNIIYTEIFILISVISYYIWIYLYNYQYFSIEFLIFGSVTYLFITNILCLMYELGKKILDTHMSYKELKQEKQIRLSLFKITHEIKNPIAVCKCYLDMLNTKDQKQVEKYIPIIKSEIERLLSLLQDFLLINKDNLDLDVMDLNMLIEDTIYKLEPLLNENNIDLKLNMLDEEVFLNGDYNRLSQVLINIIKNSIESIDINTKGSIIISTKLKNNEYYITVEDNGIGMTKETLEKIKEPFFTTKKRGSGLGVSLIHEIVEAHDGKVNYISEYGKGTKVTIQLPIYE